MSVFPWMMQNVTGENKYERVQAKPYAPHKKSHSG
jgi:hypothetical protein